VVSITLAEVSSLVVSEQPQMATQMIAKLAGLLRNSLSSPEAHAVTLREELALTEEYLSIEQVRHGKTLRVSRTYRSRLDDVLLGQ
jgi:sensor histidine kinase YesM